MDHIQIFSDKKDIPQGSALVDRVSSALRELCVVRNPALKQANDQERKKQCDVFAEANTGMATLYVYYPWNAVAVHIPAEEIFQELRTARNRNLITRPEQEKFRKAHVGIIGLSVGSNVLHALVLGGGPKYLSIADYDVIEITNLNRLRAPLWALGMNKTEYAARTVWELDPFAELSLWQKGVRHEDMERFLTNPRLDVFVDEMDSLDLKIFARELCKRERIPVVMATDNGDSVIIDVERYDEDENYPILHGRVEGIDSARIANLPYKEWLNIASRIVDLNLHEERLKESLREIGKTIAAVPQLGTTAMLAGVAANFVIRKIVMGEHMPSGRYMVRLPEAFSHSFV